MPESTDQRRVAAPRSARMATSAVFMLHAAVFAAWTPHIPLIKERLGLDDGTLGLTLLGAPVGAVGAMLAAGAAIARWGSRRVVLTMLIGYGVSSIGLGLAATPAALFAALALWGAFQAALDVAMNAQSVEVERGYGRPILSSFHAYWSMGTFVGVGLGVLAVGCGVDLSAQMAVFAAALVAVSWPVTRLLLPGDHATAGHSLALPWRQRRLLALSGLMFAGLLCEGAAGDWTALYLRESLAASPQVAGLGYSAFAVAMFAGRAVGDRWVARYGGGRVLAVLGGVAAVGMAGALAVGQPWAALVGFATLGIGLSCIVPVAISAASNQPGVHPAHAIAGVGTAGWAGFLLGPPLIGALARGSSLPVALVLLPVLCAAVAASAMVVGRPGGSTPP